MRRKWIPQLGFPDPRNYDNGDDEPVWVIGAGLDAETLWCGYHSGYFPWYSYKLSEPEWCGPIKRFVIEPHEIHISHSMRNMLNKGWYEVTIDRAFDEVIEECSLGSYYQDIRVDHEHAWLGPKMIDLYKKIHSAGGLYPEHSPLVPKSVEVWDKRDGTLVGGLYGEEVGHVFIGESMFSNIPGGSKLALIGLARHLAERPDLWLIDCQMPTDHLTSMGGKFISFDDYLDYLWAYL